MAQQSGPAKRSAGKTHQDYWHSRLVKRDYERDGTVTELANWYARIAHLGKREWFNLQTANRADASVTARKIYVSLTSRGWEATRAEFNPAMEASTDCCTVGRYLDAVKANSELRQITFEIYARKFRTLVAGAFGLRSGKEKFDYVNGGRDKFLDRIHRVRLDRLTQQKIERWKIRYLKAAEKKDPLAYKRARTTINSVIRCSKSLFAAEVVAKVKIKLPTPLPLRDVSNVTIERARFRSTFDVWALLAAAQTDLEEKHPESFKIFLLALGAGLRRDEIDTLEFSAIDWEQNHIRVETTVHTSAKSNSSEADVDVDPKLLQILKGYMGPTSGRFVIRSENEPRPQSFGSYHYRCERHFSHLIKWMRSKGVTARNPLHTLRKEFGSDIAARDGIFAASTALRHADIQLTRDYYLDKKKSSVFKLGSMLKGVAK